MTKHSRHHANPNTIGKDPDINAVFGVYMGASFAPNHKGMPIIQPGVKADFLSMKHAPHRIRAAAAIVREHRLR